MNNKVIEKFQFITDGIDPDVHCEQALKACKGGCKWVQLRIKDVNEETWLNTAFKVKYITDKYNASLIINDNADIAKKTGSAGVHLGNNDMRIDKARKYLGDDFIIGGTANTISDVIRVSSAGADYVGLGPYRFTSTKKQLSPVLGIEGFSSVMEKILKENIYTPVIAIGGIKEDDIDLILQTGIYGLAVSSYIAHSDDIKLKTMSFIDKINNYYK
jgi:thiamine-phosphate pyrophosphorylase